MTTLFISDLHLCDEQPALLDQFEGFISRQASQAEALYILGDLFAAWIGDDVPSEAAGRVAQALSNLAMQGTKIYYIHGNRDFLIRQAYADRCKMTLLPDPSLIDCEGKKILITHGDLLCTQDTSYQKMRTLFHKPWVQWLFLHLPQRLRQAIADQLRTEAGPSPERKMEPWMDVDPKTVAAWFTQHQVTIMIHGHTHKPFHHQENNTHRYVLGAWDIKPIVLEIAGGQMILRELG